MGRPASPQISNGQLILNYTGGDICGTSTPRSTIIFFSCGDSIGEPVFLTEIDCSYHFTWRSSVACKCVGARGKEGECVLWSSSF